MRKITIPLLVFFCIISGTLMTVVLSKTTSKETAFIPPEFDENAEVGEPEVPLSLGWNELCQDGMNFKVGICGNLIIENKKTDIFFYNNKDNNVWLKLRVLDENDNVLLETGLIKPNEYIKTVYFDSILNDNQKVKLKIMAYQPDTYYSEGSILLNVSIKNGG